MESLRPEIQKALEDMNWEDRLKEARARRAELLRARAAGDESGARAVSSKPVVTSIDMVERMRFGTVGDEVPPVVKQRVVARSGKRRLIYISVGFLVGIGTGVALAVAGLSLLGPERLVLDQDPLVPSETETVAEGPAAAEPQPTVQMAADTGVTPRQPEGPTVVTVIAAQPVAPDLGAVLDPPRMLGPLPAVSVKPAAISVPRIDGLPTIGTAPVATTAQALQPEAVTPPRFATDVQSLPLPLNGASEAELRNLQLISGSRSQGAPAVAADALRDRRRLPGIAGSALAGPRIAIEEPVRPELLVSLSGRPGPASLEDVATGEVVALASVPDDVVALTQGDLRSGAPADDVAPAIDSFPPEPVILGAEDMAMWIFAAATAGDDAIAAAQGMVETYKLPLRAVERVGYRISENQVRFYDATAAVAAERLAREIGAVSRDFTGSKANVPPGTLELYLAGEAAEAAEAAPPRPVARRSEPAPRPQPSATDRLRESVLSRLRGDLPR